MLLHDMCLVHCEHASCELRSFDLGANPWPHTRLPIDLKHLVPARLGLHPISHVAQLSNSATLSRPRSCVLLRPRTSGKLLSTVATERCERNKDGLSAEVEDGAPTLGTPRLELPADNANAP